MSINYGNVDSKFVSNNFQTIRRAITMRGWIGRHHIAQKFECSSVRILPENKISSFFRGSKSIIYLDQNIKVAQEK